MLQDRTNLFIDNRCGITCPRPRETLRRYTNLRISTASSQVWAIGLVNQRSNKPFERIPESVAALDGEFPGGAAQGSIRCLLQLTWIILNSREWQSFFGRSSRVVTFASKEEE